jgi:hypothetical protein
VGGTVIQMHQRNHSDIRHIAMTARIHLPNVMGTFNPCSFRFRHRAVGLIHPAQSLLLQEPPDTRWTGQFLFHSCQPRGGICDFQVLLLGQGPASTRQTGFLAPSRDASDAIPPVDSGSASDSCSVPPIAGVPIPFPARLALAFRHEAASAVSSARSIPFRRRSPYPTSRPRPMRRFPLVLPASSTCSSLPSSLLRSKKDSLWHDFMRFSRYDL